MDPTVLSELEGGNDPRTGEKLWVSVTRRKVTTPITGWPTGEYSPKPVPEAIDDISPVRKTLVSESLG